MPVYLWLLLCLNQECTSSNVYRYQAFTTVTKQADCKVEEKAMITALKQKRSPLGFRTGCKTQVEFDKEGL